MTAELRSFLDARVEAAAGAVDEQRAQARLVMIAAMLWALAPLS